MDGVSTLVQSYFSARDGELLLGGVPVRQLAESYGTPAFVYDQSVLEKKLALLQNSMPSSFSISYSMKANPSRAILRFFLSHGCGLEVASAGEFVQARAAGCPPSQLIIAGPGKTEAELEIVLKEDIGEIHAESLLELRRIATISRRLGRRARVALRVNPTGDAQGGAMRMGGKPLPFGVDEEQLPEVLDAVLRETSLDFRGIHIYAGTQILEAKVLAAQYRKALEIACRVADRVGHPLATLDFGGGLGIPYFSNEQELNPDHVRAELAPLFAEFDGDPRLKETRFVVEPGRYLVGEAGLYLMRVQDIKISREKKFLIVDGGMHHHLAASGNLGQTIKRNYPVAVITRLGQPGEETVDIVGPLCTPLDVLARGVTLPRAEVGDLIGIFQSGAYARSASPLGFLSQPAPPEVWVTGGRHRLIRRRGEPADFLRDQCSDAAAI
jgi:diaminopimelate decarboxylase